MPSILEKLVIQRPEGYAHLDVACRRGWFAMAVGAVLVLVVTAACQPRRAWSGHDASEQKAEPVVGAT